MRIPPMISIAGIDYEVEFRKDGTYNKKEKDTLETDEDYASNMVAHIDFMECKLVISDQLTDQVVDLSFWHEIIHGIDFAMGYIDVPSDPGQCFLPIDEASVEARAQLLLQVVKQVFDYNLNYKEGEEGDRE